VRERDVAHVAVAQPTGVGRTIDSAGVRCW
jgi:hypothetical protein